MTAPLVAVPVVTGALLWEVSKANREYVYLVSPARPRSVYDVVALLVVVTRTPSVGEAGATGPTTPAWSGSVGFVQDWAWSVVVPFTTATAVAGPGGVVSSGGTVGSVVAVTARLPETRRVARDVPGTSRR